MTASAKNAKIYIGHMYIKIDKNIEAKLIKYMNKNREKERK